MKQSYIISNATTQNDTVKEFMLQNGFVNTKNDDYKSPESFIMLKDFHDENVLTNNGVLFFVDTVFYVTSSF